MDQIVATGLKALENFKEQLEKAEEAVEVARVLARKIEIFEVTVGMIPNRGKKKDGNGEIQSSVPRSDEKEDEKTNNVVTTTVATFAASQTRELIMKKVEEFVNSTPYAVVKDLLLHDFKDAKTPITGKHKSIFLIV